MARGPPQARPWTQWGTCRVTDVQVHHILLVHEEHLEVLAAGRQHCFMSLKVNTIHHKSAVTQKPQLPLLVQLLQDMLAVLGKIHGWGKPQSPRVSTREDTNQSQQQSQHSQVRSRGMGGRVKPNPHRAGASAGPDRLGVASRFLC